MVSVIDAVRIVQSVRCPVGIVSVPIQKAAGRILAEPVVADRDFPPFNRVAMDGIAVNTKTFASGKKSFVIEAVHPAGSPPIRLLNELNCIEVMTGAVLPNGTDAVVRYEEVEVKGNVAVIRAAEVSKGMNIHPQGQDARKGALLLQQGQVITPAEVALLAAVGKVTVLVNAFPKIAIVSSGDELVDVQAIPQPHELRRSNAYALQAALRQAGGNAALFHLADRREEAKRNLAEILQQTDVLILSGGVSKGKFDVIPEVLTELGVEKKFHQVSQRPGKPFWFGSRTDGKVVFALPGNPVSTYLCFYKYFLPWMMEQMKVTLKPASAILGEEITFTPRLTYFLQVSTSLREGRLMATPIPGGGSGDFVNLKQVDGFLELPADKSVFKAGEAYPFIGFRHF